MSDKLSVVIALGFFDGAHTGHRSVLNETVSRAEKLKVTPAVFTFSGNLKGVLSGDKCIFTADERKKILKDCGFDEIFFAPVTQDFLSLSPTAFLDFLNEKYDIKGYVCGEDYRFGKGGAGDTETLDNYAKSRGQFLTVKKVELFKGKKISSTEIKALLKSGNISLANALLGFSYFLEGEVVCGRKVGKTLGFPTANINIKDEKSPLKEGVYKGYAEVDSRRYPAVINYGSRPTFGESKAVVEAHLIGFSGDLYGKKIRVCFDGFLRDIIAFSSAEELKAQIQKDAEKVRGEYL